MNRLDREFFNRDVVIVGRELLGKVLVVNNFRGIIFETESYRGIDDPACHAARGITPRTSVMFGPPGFSYVYFIYGMYFCFNIVCQKEGEAAAVLIRGINLIDPSYIKLDGPGKLCKHMNINGIMNKVDMMTSNFLFVEDHNYKVTNITAISSEDKIGEQNTDVITANIDTNYPDFFKFYDEDIKSTTRIGITKGIEKPWRFIITKYFKSSRAYK